MKLLAYILCFIFFLTAFLPGADNHELSKIPGLVKHYQLHAEESNINFLDFLALHYDAERTDLESPEHQTLPSFHHYSSVVLSFFIPEAIRLCHVIPFIEIEYHINTDLDYSLLLEKGNFQPPRA